MNKDIQKAKDFLRGYRNAMVKVETLELKLEEIKKSQYGTAIKYSDMPKAHNISDLSDYAAKFDEFERRCETSRFEALTILDEVTSAIDTIEDSSVRRVLYYRYISNMSWEAMLKPMMVSWRTVHNYHAKGLHQISRYLEEKKKDEVHLHS